MKTKKFLSILMALMMMLSVVPIYASAAEALSASNVTQWPTVSYKNADGKMYYGQTQSEGLIINDDEIVLDSNGNQVAGHFELRNPDTVSSPGTNMKLNITFVPDNTDEYVGFNKSRSVLLYSVEKVALVPVDENDTIPVATEVEAGSTLKTSTLSGAVYTNPINANEPNLLAESWRWAYPSTVVNESGYYEARFSPAGYDEIVVQVYVRIAGEIPETTISEVPAVDTLHYDGVTTWGDVELKGGKAVLKIEGTEIAGTFAVTEFWKTRTVNPGSYEIDVVFTPTDPEAALPYSLKIPVTVNKGQIKFVDENGNEIVPEITVPYGTDFNYIPQLLKPYVKGAEYTLISLGDLENTKCTESGTYTITASAPSDSAHYEKTELSFKLVVEPKTLAPKAYSSTEGYYVEDTSGAYRPEGTFDVYIDGKLYKTGVAYLERVAYVPETSGTHEIKFVYKPVENDNFAIENEIKNTFAINLVHKITASENILSGYGDFPYGTTVEISANIAAENFAGWKITDAQGNEVTLDGVDNSSTKITFTMPDYDIHVEALEKNATSGDGDTDLDIDLDLDFDGSHKFDFVNLIQNLIAKLKAFIQQIGDFFSNMSLEDLGNITA